MQRKYWVWIIIAVLVLAVGIPVLSILTAPLRAANQVVNKVVNADAIVSNYEWFHDQYNAIKATQKKVDIAKNALDAAKGTDAYQNRSTEYYGVQMVLQGMIGEYNSKSKQITRNLWKAKDLPYQIEE